MSAIDKNITNDEHNTQINQDGSQNEEIISEGTSSLGSTKHSEVIDDMSQNTPQPASNTTLEGTNKDSGDATVDFLNKNILTSDEMEIEMINECLNTDAGKGSGDYTGIAKATDVDDQTIEDVNVDIHIKDAITINTNVTAEKNESNDSFLDKCGKIELNKADNAIQIDDIDDDMELRWDDDDGSSPAMRADSEIDDAKNCDSLLEEQLLEEPSDSINKQTLDENSKSSEINFDSDILKDDTEETILDKDKLTDETNESRITSELDVPIEETKDKTRNSVLEYKLSEGSDINTKTSIINPEIEKHTVTNVDEDVINEHKLLEETKITDEGSDIEQEIKGLIEKSMDENNDQPLEDTDSLEIDPQEEDFSDNVTKENLDDIIDEDKLLAEFESETAPTTFKITDVDLTTDTDDAIIEESILDVTKSTAKSSEIIHETEVPTNKDLVENKDLLEDKLLEETGTDAVIYETDISMDVDNDKEVELLKDDELPYDPCTPMDVDNDQSNQDQVEVPVKNLDQRTDISSEMEIKDTEKMITELESDEDVIEISQSDDDEAKITKNVLDQPVDENTMEAAETDKSIDNQVKVTNKNIDQQIDDNSIEATVTDKSIYNQVKITNKDIDQPIDENSMEAAKTDQSVDDQAKITNEDIDQQKDENTIKDTEMEQSIDDKVNITENIRNQSIEEPAKTVINRDKKNNDQTNITEDEPDQTIVQPAQTAQTPPTVEINKDVNINNHIKITEKMIDQLVEESLETEINIHQPVEQPAGTAETNKDKPVVEQAVVTEQIIDQTVEESTETVKINTDIPIDDQDIVTEKIIGQTNEDSAKTIDIYTDVPFDGQDIETEKNIDQTVKKSAKTIEITTDIPINDQAVETEKIIEHTIEDSAKTIDINKDKPIEDQDIVTDTIIGQPIEQPVETAETNIDEPLNDQAIVPENIIKKTIEDKPIVEQIMVTEETIDQPIEPSAETIEINTNKLIENQAKTIIEQGISDETTIENEIIDQTESGTKNIEPPIDSQAKTDDNNIEQRIESSNIPEETSNSPLQSETHIDSTVTEIQIDNSEKCVPGSMLEMDIDDTEPLKPAEDMPENINIDTNETDEILASNSSICLEDSPKPIKTAHSLYKPDVMLEIPSQELIDMDDTDLSMSLDQSEVIDSTNDVDLNPDDDLLKEKTVDKISDNDTVNEKAVDQEAIAPESTVGEVQKDNIESTNNKKCVESIDKDTIEESLEKMFADEEPAVVKDVVNATTSPIQEPDVQPSTSVMRMTPDTSDEVPEVSDSLGLLAESSGRMMEDDEEPDDDDDGDDDDDFDQDESSNQISAEQSEDSNPPVLESEPVRDTEDKEIETPDPKDEQFQFIMSSVTGAAQDKEEKMDIEEEYGTVPSMNDEETRSAVNALLKDGAPEEQIEDPQEAADQMDIETVKLSDTSDNEVEIEPTNVEQQVVAGLSQEVEEQDKPNQSPSKSPIKSSNQSPYKQLSQSPCKHSPSKMKKLEITTQEASSVVNIVDLEESSSSEDEIQEVQKQPEADTAEKPTTPDPEGVTNVNIPTGIEIMCTSGGNTSEIVTKEGEVVISGVPKPPPHKPARLNTSEVSIKTACNSEPMIIPETKINEQATANQSKPKLGLEIFSLDSDEEDGVAKEKPVTTSPPKMTALELEKARETSKCINYCCTSGNKVPYIVADASVVSYYDAGRKRKSMVCQPCADVVANRNKNLIQGIKDLTPLLELEMGKLSQDLVEISDSESEDEDMTPEEPKETIGETGAKFVEDNLTKFLNDTWKKYDMDTRLKETQIMLDDEIEKLEQDSKEIDAMLNECQVATDKLRCELYATFECRRKELPALVLYDMPNSKFIGLEADTIPNTVAAESTESRRAKRRMSASNDTPAKRPAIPLGYAPLDADSSATKQAAIPLPDVKMADDDKDISVVKLSAESAPPDLPPPGEISRPPLRVSMPVYAMKNAFGPWLKGRVLEIQPKNAGAGVPFSLCRVKFDHKAKTNGKVLSARCIAYAEPADVRMTIGTRLIALFKDSNKRESYYSGVVAEIPNPVNNYRYLVFFDDGYAQYVQHQYTRLVCESSPLVWEEVHPFSREFVREYLLAYPERPMVRLHEGQHLKTEWNGKWWSSRVTRVDASLAQVMFVGDGRREWIYRGSTRLAPLYLELRAAERHRPRPMPRSKAQPRLNMPYVEYTRSDEQQATKQLETQTQEQQQQSEEIRRQRAVAKKSTSIPSIPQAPPPPQQQMSAANADAVTSRVVYYTPKNAVKPYKMTPHKCSPKCKRSDVLSLKELRTYNPLAKPLLSGWERQIVRYKGHKEVMYRAPCGRRVRGLRELHAYLRATDSDLPVDLFDFHHATHCLAEFVLNKCLVGKKDLSHGKENVPVPCVNYYDDSLPEFCSYNTERTPTAGVPLNLDPEFLCGCDCTDDCQDKSKCACWKMTLEGARTIGLKGPNVGYVYKRLPEPLPSGIYECNSRCKCKHTCLNRVAQHPLQLKLQVFKTLNRGWGIRALNDVPKGSFLCVYAGNLLTDATANLDGLNEGDEYLAELDYIEVVEQMKEGYEEDIPEADKKLDKKELGKDDNDSEEEEPSSSDEEDTASKTDKEDDDFRPGYIGLGVMEFNKRLRKREKSKKDKEEKSAVDEKEKEKDTKESKDSKETKESNGEEDCITISDDEEVREPSRFTVQAGMGASEFISKYKSVRTLFGKDEACYIMDAKVQGNIGRYLNHSCCPNVFVQNVFVDTHDPRFPWVAFFALSHIKAGTELTWNYNYDVGSVPGKVLYCFCGAPNCRGRLL